MAVPDLAPRELCAGVVARPLGMTCDTRLNVNTEGRLCAPAVDDARFFDGLRRAVRHGPTLLDTSDAYGLGHSERVIGRLLREYPEESILLSSKVGRLRGSAPHPYAGRHIHHQFEQTLENFYAEHLDLYFLESFNFGEGDRYLDTAIDQMRTLQQLGCIKALGMRGPHAGYGASPAEQAAHAQRFLHLFRLIRPDVVWTRFNAFTPTVSLEGEDLFSFAAREGVGLVLAAPLAHGLLAGKPVESARRPSAEGQLSWVSPTLCAAVNSGLHALRERFGHTRSALIRAALRYCLQRADRAVVIFGFTDEEQVNENVESLGRPLTVEELAFIDDVYARMRAAFGVIAELQGPTAS
jgi:aryl-alcohol dehydrogenase-like predicted oxidoreductase